MITKIKSRKIANVKFLVGFVLAASLVAVFACEQKDSVKTELVAGEKTVTLVADGHSLQINGDSAGIEKLRSIIAESGDYELNVDGATGEMKLTGKNNKVGEIVAVAYDGQEKSAKVDEEVFFVVDEMPEFPGGQLALRQHIAQAVKYPVKAQENGIQGKVFVTFVVAKDGSVKNAKVVRGVDPSLDQEALRVVNSLPKWKPGKHKGEIVAVSYTVPINFVLQ